MGGKALPSKTPNLFSRPGHVQKRVKTWSSSFPPRPAVPICVCRHPHLLLAVHPPSTGVPWRPRPHLHHHVPPPPDSRDHCSRCQGSEAVAKASECHPHAGGKWTGRRKAKEAGQRGVGYLGVDHNQKQTNAFCQQEDR